MEKKNVKPITGFIASLVISVVAFFFGIDIHSLIIINTAVDLIIVCYCREQKNNVGESVIRTNNKIHFSLNLGSCSRI